jgi:carbamoyl-phosphate synthase large subunit
MTRRVLVTSAGTGASNNLIRSLKAGDASLCVVGCHDDRFVLKNSPADRNYLLPPPHRPGFLAAVRRVVTAERVGLLLPASDGDVRRFARLRGRTGGRLYLPRRATIERCQDKYGLTAFLQRRGIPAPVTFPVRDPGRLAELFARLPDPRRGWCRVRAGTGAFGAVPVRSAAEARDWIRCWTAIRGVPARAFTLSEYLPGRDIGCQSLWKDGRLVLIKTYERLSYLTRGDRPGRAASTAALARTVSAPAAVDTCRRAVRALDPRASGAFSIDLKEDAAGVPRITEVSAGRLSSATNILDLAGKHNMALTYVSLGLGEPVELCEEYDVAEDHYMLRDVDTLPALFHADELFEGVADVRG